MDTRRTREFFSLTVDLVMVILIIANLTLILIDWGFQSTVVQRQLQYYVPAVYHWYDRTIHQHFLFYDLAFVAIFVAEILVRWGWAIYQEWYARWFFYPFVHWYDVIGCIPVSSLRSLRLLRVIAMIPKIQRIGLLDLRETYPYQKYLKYRNILLEEISDQVTIRIIESLQQEIRGSEQVTKRIAEEVIEPQREALIQAVTHRFQEATAVAYSSQQADFQKYLDEVITDAVNQNREISTIASFPGVGKPIATLLERAISDIVFNVIDQMVADVASLENDRAIAEVTAISTDALVSPKYDRRLNQLARSVVLQSLDVIKDHVQVRGWRNESSSTLSPAPSS